MASVINGLTPLDAADLVNISLDELRKMSMEDLVALAFRLGVDPRQIHTERGRLLSKIMDFAADA